MAETGRRVCIFCGKTPVTKEHLFGDSMRKHVTESGRVRSHDLRTGKMVGSVPSAFDLQIRRVCASCNNGWMNRVDQDARAPMVELIQGTPTVLDRRTLTGIAASIGKIALLRGYMQVAQPPTSVADRDTFYRSHRPPKRWHIWLGHIENIAVQDRLRHQAFALVKKHDLEVRLTQLRDLPVDDDVEWSFSYMLGIDNFFALVVGVTSDHAVHQATVRTFESVIESHDLPLVRIWPNPPSTPIAWPLSEALPASRIEQLDTVLDTFMEALRAQPGVQEA